ncbi:unnamed protein product [Vicia faba]|uniref:E3 ubiquitin-protein ligase RHG1A n=1 Tax=Vicia faba TaxID=3906 RepID=A0AAV1B758_VICFA|nr:unnamed protein product [Vicia faba]
MQGQRRTVGSFPAIVSKMPGPSSNGTDMNHQSPLNHVQNSVDFRLSDYRGSSGESACLRGSAPNVSFNGWNTGEHSSGLNLINQVNDDALISEHRLSSSCSAIAEDGQIPEERQLLGNQSRIHPSFLQGSSSNHTAQNINLGMGHIGNSSDRGKGKETSSGVNNNNPCGLDREKTPLGSSSFNHTGASSASSGYMAWGDSSSSSSSLANWGPSCKRKTLEGSSMQLCTGESSSSLLQSENGYWPTDSVDLNVPGSLGDLSPLDDFRVTSPPFQQNTRNEVRQEASNMFPSMIGVAESVERPLRNFDRRITHLQHPESVPLNLTSTGSARHHNYPSPHQTPVSLSFSESLDLRLTAGVTAANSAVPQTQSPSLHMHPFTWNRAANPRVARSSSSYNSGERAVREDFNLRIFPRDSTEHPMNLPASSGHEPSVPTENLQRVSEFSPWSLFPSISSASGAHNGHSPSTSGPLSFSQGSSSSQPHPRTSYLMERRGDVLPAPHSLRTLPADNEGRRRLISEIRQVLIAMRRGESLRAEV